jgi:protein SCO1/2
MARLQQRLGISTDPKLRLVSFTVDPDFDTPEILRSYAARLHADPQGWLFLSGPRPSLYDLIKDGFHLSVAERDDAAGGDPNEMITHSDRFVLVDRDGAIRGYYHGDDEESVNHMLDDLAELRRES